jgi:hypothetical protein
MKLKILIFQDKLGTLLEMRLSGVAEQNYTVSYRKYQIKQKDRLIVHLVDYSVSTETPYGVVIVDFEK